MSSLLIEQGRIAPVDSIGCSAAVISATGKELLEWMGLGVVRGELQFPEANGPARWPGAMLPEILRPRIDLEGQPA